MYSYDWQNGGLLLTTPYGTVFLQGDDASELYDTLESATTDEEVVCIISEYEVIAENYE